MIWTSKGEEIGQGYDKIVPIGRILEIESLDRYVLKIEKDESYDKMKLVIEDRINRYNLIFENPYKDRNNESYATQSIYSRELYLTTNSQVFIFKVRLN